MDIINQEIEAKRFLKLLGKDPKQTWLRYLKQWRKPAGTGNDRRYPELVPDANAYFITGNGNPANGRTLEDSDIKSCPALFVEWDDKPLEWQVSAWIDLGLPEPSIQVHTGGKSIHCYWVLEEPMAPAAWRELIKRVISHCGGDTANCNPSRVMRLPGSIYYDKKTGAATTNTAKIIHSSERRYSAAEIEACLPQVLAKATLKPAASTRFAAPSSQWEPRTEADLINALKQVPAFDHDQGRREELLGLAFRLTAEIGAERGLQLMQEHSPAVSDMANYFKTEPTQINAGSIWPFLREHYNVNISRTSQKQVSTKPEGFAPTEPPTKPKAKKAKKHKQLCHTSAMKCFDRCVYIQCKKERNSFRRRVRLLKAAKDLDLASYINRVEIAEKVLDAKQQSGDGGFKPLTAADRAAMKKPVIHWLLPGLMPANDLTILGGRPKVGKTRLAVAMAAAVLKVEALFDLPKPAKAVPVVLVTDDQSDGDTASMLEAVDLWGHPNLIWSRNFRISETDLDKLLETIKANPGALVIIDSLRSISRSMQKGENDPEIGAVLYDLKQAVMDAGGTLLLIHHCNKAADLVGVEALSGHNAIAGAANTVLTMHYLLGENNQPNKSIPERQLFREARSGDGFDLVITRDGNSFRSLGSMESHKEKAQEQKQLMKLSHLQYEVRDVVDDEWLTRRQVCEALAIEWGDRGREKAAQQVGRALRRLVEIGELESVRAGIESTYRSLDRMGTEIDATLMTVMPPSHTNGLHVTTIKGSSDDIDDNSHADGSGGAPAFTEKNLATMASVTSLESDKTNQPEPLLSQDDSSVITDSLTSNGNKKKSKRGQTKNNLTGLSDPSTGDLGSGYDAAADGDDPHWGARP